LSKHKSDPTTELALIEKFCEDHKQVLNDEKFGNFIFALCTQLYLNNQKPKGSEQKTYLIGGSKEQIGVARNYMMEVVLHLSLRSRYNFRSEDRPKFHKFIRDVDGGNERGIIKCLARETAYSCKCMEPKKSEARIWQKLLVVVDARCCKKVYFYATVVVPYSFILGNVKSIIGRNTKVIANRSQRIRLCPR